MKKVWEVIKKIFIWLGVIFSSIFVVLFCRDCRIKSDNDTFEKEDDTDEINRKAAAKREKRVQQKKEVTAHIEPSESAQMATTPEKATTVLDEIDAAYENYSINATNQLKSFKANLFSLTWAQRMPSDTEIKDTLKTLKIYSLSSSRTKTILDKLENNRRKEYVPTSEYTIEHIMPQTLSDDWKSDLGADANRIHETYVHTIGNLTLTGYNSEYQNKRFSDKVDCTDKAGNAIGYRHTPIRISSYLTTVSKWGEAEILARAEMLSDELIAIWKYPKKD